MKPYTLITNTHQMALGKKTLIMGILNVTPDSFSDGGHFFQFNHAIEHALQMEKQGADIIDIGGESTRPFAKSVSVEEEIQRVIPVIQNLSNKLSIPISIDTQKAEVAKQAIQSGASIVNDISALRDPDMVNVVAEYQTPLIIMHMQGTPETMQLKPEYTHLLSDIHQFFEKTIAYAEKNGVNSSKIIIDPGIGFGKSLTDNYQLIKYLHYFSQLDLPLLIGPSRKSFIRKIVLENQQDRMIDDKQAIEIGTQAAIAVCALHGAHIVRVHDVAQSQITLKIIDMIRNV